MFCSATGAGDVDDDSREMGNGVGRGVDDPARKGSGRRDGGVVSINDPSFLEACGAIGFLSSPTYWSDSQRWTRRERDATSVRRGEIDDDNGFRLAAVARTAFPHFKTSHQL